jgi:hypothetical protein
VSERWDPKWGPKPTDEDVAAMKVDWDRFVATCHAKGQCEFSGLRVTQCVNSICDCFETIEGAQEIERKAGLRE